MTPEDEIPIMVPILDRDQIPQDHTCACPYCSPLIFGSLNRELSGEEIDRGHFNTGLLGHSHRHLRKTKTYLDGVATPTIWVYLGSPPWAVLIPRPVHICFTCQRHLCHQIVFPKHIEIEWPADLHLPFTMIASLDDGSEETV